MFDKNRLYRDCFALALAALVVFLTLALVSYDRADPVAIPVAPFHLAHAPDLTVFPANELPRNFCGNLGALAADALYSWFGLAAYYALFSAAVLAVQILRRREIDCPALRMFGWIASLAGLATILAIALPNSSPGPVIGAG